MYDNLDLNREEKLAKYLSEIINKKFNINQEEIEKLLNLEIRYFLDVEVGGDKKVILCEMKLYV